MAKTARITIFAPPSVPGLTAVRASGIANAFPRHAHEHYVLGVMTQGARRIRLADRDVLVPTGGVFALNPGQAHACSPHGAPVMGYLALGFPPALLIGAAGRAPVLAGPVIDDPFLASHLTGLFGLFGLFESFNEEGDACLEKELGAIRTRLRDHYLPGEGPAPELAGADRLALVREHLERQHERQVSLVELGRLAGLSACHLQRRFLGRYGQTPTEYLLRCRVRAAQALIEERSSLSEAALGAGFFDQSHFTRVFKRLVGVSPGVYRRSALTPLTAAAR